MSADLLRRAAASMREQHGPDHVRHDMWSAMADWLDHAAARSESKVRHGGNERVVWSQERDAVEVARTYLNEPAT